jgi:hypothetical protein
MAKFKKSVPKTVNLKDAKFAYFSQCCNEIAEKPTLSMPQGKGIGTYLGAKPETDNTQGLGGWRCSRCKKPCKVNRQAKQSAVPVQESLHD